MKNFINYEIFLFIESVFLLNAKFKQISNDYKR